MGGTIPLAPKTQTLSGWHIHFLTQLPRTFFVLRLSDKHI